MTFALRSELRMKTTLATALIALVMAKTSPATAGPDTLTVAISPFPPCVIEGEDGYTGFDIDLWEAIATDLGVPFRFLPVRFSRILDLLVSGEADAALAGITINAQRERIVDFSQHYLDSGLRIMVRSEPRSELLERLASLFRPGILRGLLYLLLFVFLCGHVVWLSERGEEAVKDRYFPGIFEAFWLVIVTITTVGYGDIAPRKWLGRLASFMVMLVGIGLFGWIISEFAAATTVQRLEGAISRPDDLEGKVVATVHSTTSVKTVEGLGAYVVEVPRPQDAFAKLLSGEVDAVVYDAPNLLYFAENEGAGKVTVVGELFEQQYYGIAFPQGSPLREQVNRALLKLREKHRGTSAYDIIYRRWFGKSF